MSPRSQSKEAETWDNECGGYKAGLTSCSPVPGPAEQKPCLGSWRWGQSSPTLSGCSRSGVPTMGTPMW